MNMNCLIVDDEPYAAEVLSGYIQKIAYLQLVGTCKNALEVSTYLRDFKIDLVFLDIEMPLLNGIDFLKTLHNPPNVIITTAHREYAIEGFELEVTDYLLKPIPFHRFVKAVNRIFAKSHPSVIAEEMETKKDHIFFKVDKRIVKVVLDEILYIESLKDYVRVKTINENLIVYQTITGLESILPSQQFLRVQKSFIISIDKVRSMEGNMIEIGDKQISLSRLQKEELTNIILSRGISGLRLNPSKTMG